MTQPTKLTLTLETVTPLFLHGADPTREPELRPPSFRGAMRYWLRAALGGAIGDSDVDGLRALEAEVFGSTGGASPIGVRLSGQLRSGPYPVLPHKDSRNSGQRMAFAPGQTFCLALERFSERGSKRALQTACAALDLALTCGGVGLRSRRGYGTLRVVESSAPDLIAPSPDSYAGWRERAKEAINGARKAARALARDREVAVAERADGPARFPSLSGPVSVKVFDLKAASAIEAVTEFMSRVPQHRAFGGIRPRQASPLWIRPVRIGTGYGLLCTVVPSAFPGADYERIDRFLKDNFSRQRPGQRG